MKKLIACQFIASIPACHISLFVYIESPTVTMAFWKPGTTAPGSTIDREGEDDSNIISYSSQSALASISQQRQRLPIYKNSKFSNGYLRSKA